MTLIEIEAAVRPLLTEAAILERKAKELRALAADYEDKLTSITGLKNRSDVIELTVEGLVAAIQKKNGRARDYAERLGVTVAQVERLIAESDGRIKPDGRGWLKLQEDFQAAA